MILDELIGRINQLKESDVGDLVRSKIKEFEKVGKGSNEDLFRELVFCILTANFSAEGALRILESLGNEIFTLPQEDLTERLAELGHRYPKRRAEFIVEARKLLPILRELISSFKDERILREWLVRNVKGLGYKEASHFLRNVGFKNVSIIDFHVLDLLAKFGIIDERPRNLSRRRYLMIESLLEKISKIVGVSLAELDLYLWYMETGKVIK